VESGGYISIGGLVDSGFAFAAGCELLKVFDLEWRISAAVLFSREARSAILLAGLFSGVTGWQCLVVLRGLNTVTTISSASIFGHYLQVIGF